MFTQTKVMPTAAESIAAWIAWASQGEDLAGALCIRDRDATHLPPLPAGLRKLNCNQCCALRSLPLLPAGLQTLFFRQCLALRSLPPLTELCLLRELYCTECRALHSLPILARLYSLLRLNCSGCPALCSLPLLPPGLRVLYCSGCPALRSLPPLPVGLRHLACPALRSLPALPAGLMMLHCAPSTRRPDDCPFGIVLNCAAPAASRTAWQQCVAAQHARDRGATAAALPAAALLYV